MKILVTGVKGQLGYDCVRELTERGYTNVKGIDIDDLDLTKEEDVKKYINEYKPDVVMHNAAWTAVDKAEEMPDKVYEVKRSIAYTFDYTDDIPKYNGSRVGGSPYAEEGMEASVTYNNEKMKFLFQLNLSEVNLPDGFPDRGLLQFFIMDKERYEGCIKVLYHPHIDTMSSGDVNGAVAIRLIQNTIPSSLSVKLEDIYNAAYELGIYLSPDLELSDFYDNGLLVETNEDYLLGATRLLPPINPYASDYSDTRIPLLYVSPESPLINKWCENISDTYIEGFQIFISRAGITERDFDKIVVCA